MSLKKETSYPVKEVEIWHRVREEELVMVVEMRLALLLGKVKLIESANQSSKKVELNLVKRLGMVSFGHLT